MRWRSLSDAAWIACWSAGAIRRAGAAWLPAAGGAGVACALNETIEAPPKTVTKTVLLIFAQHMIAINTSRFGMDLRQKL
jgi:hypothetical protein